MNLILHRVEETVVYKLIKRREAKALPILVGAYQSLMTHGGLSIS